jgi:ADP-dependent NAD(P)H-hydrate dehydratase / NAD(P)H-hydrate epimerase
VRVVTPDEMARVDRATMERGGTSGLALMERAGEEVARAARGALSQVGGRRVGIWCGKGNNGGDGFVAARLLGEAGMDVTVLLLADPDLLQGDAGQNFRRLQNTPVVIIKIELPADIDACRQGRAPFDVVIDAIFGTGFSGRAEGIFQKAIGEINGSGGFVIAIDIPSGVAGLTGAVEGIAVRADMTVTLAAPKVGLLQFPGAREAGILEVVDIGIPQHLMDEVPESSIYLMTEEDAGNMLPERARDAHKRECGSVLVVGGSPGLTGAAALCAQAALRTGAGLVTLGVPEGVHDIVEVKLTEVMTRPLPQTSQRTLSLDAAGVVNELSVGSDVLALGPGLSTEGETPDAVREIVRTVGKTVVLDADGLNAMVGYTRLFEERAGPLVLTPHPGEMARLIDGDTDRVQSNRVAIASEMAARWGVVVVLKGAGTVTAEPGGSVWINSTGNPGMSTAGMGDVLTGCIAAFIAQGVDTFNAAALGVYYHGCAADLVSAMDGMIGMTAGDVLRHLPLALRTPRGAEER